MKLTLNIDSQLLEQATRLTGIESHDLLVKAALESLVAREAGRRLAALGGTDPRLKPIPRRRPRPT